MCYYWINKGNILGMLNTETIRITPEILSMIAEIDEFKGAWKAIGLIAPEQLTALRKVATIESVGSSTRIEGSKLSDKEVEKLLSNLSIGKFTSRDEQEVAGYAEVMNIVFLNYQNINFTENYIQQLHQELMQFSEKDNWHRGYYKKSTNHVEAFDSNGKSLGVVFETASPFETPNRMKALVDWTNKELAERRLHPLIVTALFTVVFLAIHPFQDGNGRLSRILTTLLLLKQKYEYVPFASIEAIVEQSKEAYYLALRQTQGTINTENPNWQPWLSFFLNTMRKHKLVLENKIEKEKILWESLPELSYQILELIKSRGRITVQEIVLFTNANRNTVKKHLENLVKTNRITKHGVGKGTWYANLS